MHRHAALALLALPSVAPAQEAPVQDAPVTKTFDQRLAGHRAFGKLAFHKLEDYPPFVLYVQQIVDEPGGFAEQSGKGIGPWLQTVERTLRTDYLEPAGVLERGLGARYPVVLLASSGDYTNYLQTGGRRLNFTGGGGYDSKLGAVVGYQDAYGSRRPAFRQRFPILRDAVLAIFRAYLAEGREEPGSEWLIGGLAEYLTYHTAPVPSRLVERPFEGVLLESLHRVLRDLDTREFWWLDPATLIGVHDAKSLTAMPRTWFQGPAKAAPASIRSRLASIQWMFRAQSRVWMAFLHGGAEGRYRPQLPGLVRAALDGELDLPTVTAALGAEDLARLDHELIRYLNKPFEEVLRMKPVRISTEAPSAAATGAEAAASDATEPDYTSGSSGAPFDPGELAVAIDSDELRLAQAQYLARAGRLGEALGLLESALNGVSDEVWSARLTRERDRVLGLRRVYESWLSAVVAGKKKLRVPVGDKMRAFDVERLDENRLVFSRGRDGVESWARDDITLELLLENVGRRIDEYGPDWAEAYALFLLQDERWSKAARGDDARLAALREDAPALQDALRLGQCLVRLNDLSGRELPADAASAEQVLSDIFVLRELGQGLSSIEAKLPVLAGFARAALAARYADLGPDELLAGQWTELDGGRVSLRYDFESPAELLDFEPGGPSMETYRERKSSEVPAERNRFRQRGSCLFAEGSTTLAHLLTWSGPMEARLVVRYVDSVESEFYLSNVMVFLLNNASNNRLAAALNFQGAAASTRRGQAYDYPDNPHAIDYGDELDVQLTVTDKERFEVRVNGELVADIAADGVELGRFGIGVHANHGVEFETIVLEGQPTPGSLSHLRESIVERELAAMGFAQ